MNKIKKISIGALTAVAAITIPVATVVSCGKKETKYSVNLKEVKSKFDKANKESIELKIKYTPIAKDQKGITKEYKDKISEFLLEDSYKSKIMDMAKMDKTNADKIKDMLTYAKTLKEFEAKNEAPTFKDLEKTSKTKIAAFVEKIRIKHFTFYGTGTKTSTIDLPENISKKLEESEMSSIKVEKLLMDNLDAFMRFSKATEADLKKLSDEDRKLAAKHKTLQDEADKKRSELTTALEN